MKPEHLDYQRFSTVLRAGDFWYAQLWNRNPAAAHQGSCIQIRKEVWCSVGPDGETKRKKSDLSDTCMYAVYFVYNMAMHERTVPDHGCKVNKEPFFTLAEALAQAKIEAQAARPKWEVKLIPRE